MENNNNDDYRLIVWLKQKYTKLKSIKTAWKLQVIIVQGFPKWKLQNLFLKPKGNELKIEAPQK